MTGLRASALASVSFALALVACTSSDDGGTSDEMDASTSESGETSTGETTSDTTGETTSDTTGDTTSDTTTETTGGVMSDLCEAFATLTPTDMIAATTPDDAATATTLPDSTALYHVILPEGAPGYVELQIPDWETTQAFVTDTAIEYTISTSAQAHVAQPRVPVAGCEDISEQHVFFPHWTPATIEFAAEGPREIRLMIVQVSP
jgi:hypothetical protein